MNYDERTMILLLSIVNSKLLAQAGHDCSSIDS